jgi:DNA-binding NarL/FixJ family response regulator
LVWPRKREKKGAPPPPLYTLGFVAMFQAKLGEASALLEECLALRRELGDAVGVGRTLWTLAVVAVARHNYGQTLELYEGSLALARETGDTLMIALSLGVGALAHLGRGDHGRARKLCMEGLELSWQLRHTHACAFHLHVLSVLAGSEGQLARSVRLWGAAEALLEVIGTSLSPLERDYYEPYLAAVRTQLDEGAWDAALRDGRAMNLEVALDYALRKEQPASRRSERAFASETPGQLTRREKEVAGLVAQGLTNRQIASEFMVSERTIDNHVANILKKLGLRSRAEVADRMDQL